MNEAGRWEIPEWIVWLALLLLLALAPLPFVTEGNVDRYLRVMLASSLFIFPLIMLLATMFPRGLRLRLGRVVLRIAPPAAYFISYYSASRWLKDVRSRFPRLADELEAIKGEQDAMTAEIMLLNAEIAGDIGLDSDPAAKLANDLFFRVYTNYDAVLGAAIAAAIDALREKLTQPPAATAAGILDQVAALGSASDAATRLIRARMDTGYTFVNDTIAQARGMAQDSSTRLEQRSQAGAAQIAAIEAEVAEVTKRGRGRPTMWTLEKTQPLYADYLAWTGTYNAEFLQRHGLKNRTQMYELFDRYGLRRKPGELTDN